MLDSVYRGDEHSVGARRRIGAMSKVACASCRRLKMKCIQAEGPPCARGAKTGRFCIIPQSDQKQKPPANIGHFQNSSQHCLSSTPQTPRYVPDCGEKELSLEYDTRQNLKPPIYRNSTTLVPVSGPAFDSVASQGHWSSLPLHAARLHADPAFQDALTDPVYGQSRRIANAWPVAGDTNADCVNKTSLDDAPNGVVRDGPSLPSDEEVFHLSRFFITNLLHHIPVIAEHDLTDFGTAPGPKRPLAYCMAYVAARFMPGCKAIRTALTSSVASIARLQLERYHDGQSTEENQWTQLQALAILYNWAPSQHPESSTIATPDNFPAELRRDMLRASIETLARHHSLHRSAADVIELLKLNVRNVQQSSAFRKYLYWLWLFSEAHFWALVSQSPPSIREDASIMQAVQLLDNIANDDWGRQVLAGVELCLLWSRAALRERNLSEWWCTVQTQMTLESSLALLDDLDAATRNWHQKWHPPEKASLSQKAARAGKDGMTEFYYHFTCFCLGDHVARAIQSSTIAESLPLLRIHSLTKTIDRGNTLCRLFLELSPLAKYSVCFSPEIVYAMIAACCESLLQILSLTGELGLSKSMHLSTIRHVAELMVDLSIDEKQGAKGRGQHIVARMRDSEATSMPSVPQQTTAHLQRSTTWPVGGGEQQAAHTLLSFVPVTGDVLSVQQVLNQRDLPNGHHHGFTSGPGESIGMWASYNASEPVGSADSYWTS